MSFCLDRSIYMVGWPTFMVMCCAGEIYAGGFIRRPYVYAGYVCVVNTYGVCSYCECNSVLGILFVHYNLS